MNMKYYIYDVCVHPYIYTLKLNFSRLLYPCQRSIDFLLPQASTPPCAPPH